MEEQEKLKRELQSWKIGGLVSVSAAFGWLFVKTLLEKLEKFMGLS